MKIERVVKYKYNGVLYESEKAASAANEDAINLFINRMINKINNSAKNAAQYMPARAEIEITQHILDNRAMLADLLNVTSDDENDE